MERTRAALLVVAGVLAIYAGWVFLVAPEDKPVPGKAETRQNAEKRAKPGGPHLAAVSGEAGKKTALAQKGNGEQGAGHDRAVGSVKGGGNEGATGTAGQSGRPVAENRDRAVGVLSLEPPDTGDGARKAGDPGRCRSHLACDDENPCTRDLCKAGRCESHMTPGCHACGAASDCPGAPGPCLEYRCDPTVGICVAGPKNCDDGVKCTTDRCDPATGQCVHEGDCCYAIADCDDSDPCTEDICDKEANKCRYEEADCDDGNPCTQDWCEPFKGCSYLTAPGCDQKCASNTDCQDNNLCTTDECNLPEGVCSRVPISCEDGDFCTQDYCDPEVGCVHTRSKGCDGCSSDADCPLPVGNLCVTATCDPTDKRCSHEQKVCDDGDDCTEDYCVPESGACASHDVCCQSDADCDFSNKCSKVTCTQGKCLVEPLKCDDGNECTMDSCDVDVGCVHELREGCKRHYETH